MTEIANPNTPHASGARVSQRCAITATAAALVLSAAGEVGADPLDGIVVRGAATIESNAGTTQITQSTDRAIIDWRSFSIAANERVDFLQPSSSSATLNRVLGGQRSIIEGALTANGHVLLLNPSGVLFGPSARVDVGGLVATTSRLSNDDFLADRLQFVSSGVDGGTVENLGRISARDGGVVALVAPTVRNAGVINARMGRVALGGVDRFTVDLYGDRLIHFALPGSAAEIGGGTGSLVADGGVLGLSPTAASAVVGGVTNLQGFSPAQSASRMANGDVLLDSGAAINSGRIDVSGRVGGDVDVIAGHVALGAGSLIDASGDEGGGAVRIGGAAAGDGGPRAATVDFAAGAQVRADAVTTGNGGRVTVWGQQLADFRGAISTRGGSQSGDGGFVEVSSADVIRFLGDVYLDAPRGNGGLLFLDPDDVVILPIGSSSLNASVIDSDALSRILRNGGDVVLTATNSIQVLSGVDGRGGASPSGRVALTAGSLIVAQPIITNNNAITLNATSGSITFRGNGYLYVAGATQGVGSAAISVAAGQGIITESGGSADAGQLVSLGPISLTATAGNVRMLAALSGLQTSSGPTGIGALTVRAGGSVELSGARSLGAVDVRSGAAGSITNSTGSIVAAMGIRLEAGSGGITVNAVGGSAATRALSATGGEVVLLTPGAVSLQGSVVADAGAVCVGAGADDACTTTAAGISSRIGSLTSAAGSIVRSVGAAGGISIFSSGDVSTGDLQSTNGLVRVNTQDGNAATSGAVTLAPLSQLDGGLTVLADGAVSLRGANAMGALSVSGSGITTAENTVAATGDVTLTATGAGGITIGAVRDAAGVVAASNQALRSSTGAVRLQGSATSPVTINGSVVASAGTLTIDSVAPASTGVASITTATGTVLQTGTSASTGGALTLRSVGNTTINGALLAGTTSPVTVTTTGTGGVTFANAIAGYADATGTGQGVGAISVNAGGSVELSGARSLGAVDVRSGAAGSITNSTGSIVAAMGIRLEAGSGGITVNAVGGSAATRALSATGGEVVLLTPGAVSLQGSVVADAGAVCVGAGADDACTTTAAGISSRIGSLTSAAGSIVRSVGAAGGISIFSSGDVSTGDLQSTNGLVRVNTQDGNAATSGAVTLAPLSQLDGGLTVLADGAVSLRGANAMGALSVSGSGITTAENTVAATGDVTLTATGAGGITIGAVRDAAGVVAASNQALRSSTGAVRLQGSATSPVTINGSVVASAGTLTIDSVAPASTGVASITTATGTVLQTGTSASTGGALTLRSVGNTTINGALLAGTTSPVTVTTTGTGGVTFANAIAGYADATGTGQGVGAISVNAGGSVTLRGASANGAIAVTGSSIATGGSTIRTVLASALNPPLGGDIVLTSTGAGAVGGIRIGCIGAESSGACASLSRSYAIESAGRVVLQTLAPSTINILGNTIIEGRSDIEIGAMVAPMGDINSNALQIGPGGLDIYVANRSSADTSLGPFLDAGPSTAWNLIPRIVIATTIRGTNVSVSPNTAPTFSIPPGGLLADGKVVQPAQISISGTPLVRVVADFPYIDQRTGGLIPGPGAPLPTISSADRLVDLSVNGVLQTFGVWRLVPFLSLSVCDFTRYFAKPGTGAPATFGTTTNTCGGGGSAGTSSLNLATLVGLSVSASGGLGSAGDGRIVLAGGIGDSSAPGSGAATPGSGPGQTGPGGAVSGGGASGGKATDAGLAASASAEDRRDDAEASKQNSSEQDDGEDTLRCPRGAAGLADLGRTAATDGASADVFQRCTEALGAAEEASSRE